MAFELKPKEVKKKEITKIVIKYGRKLSKKDANLMKIITKL